MLNKILLLQESGASSPDFSFMIMMGLVLVVMYFFIFRPQSKKAKEEQQFSDSINKGEKVVTKGGIHGRVVRVDTDTVVIEIDSNAKLKVEKSAISHELSKKVAKKSES